MVLESSYGSCVAEKRVDILEKSCFEKDVLALSLHTTSILLSWRIPFEECGILEVGIKDQSIHCEESCGTDQQRFHKRAAA